MHTIIFDFDDTLIVTHSLYTQVIDQFFAKLGDAGLYCAETTRNVFNQVETDGAKLHGFIADRFPRSMYETTLKMFDRHEKDHDLTFAEEMHQHGWSVYDLEHPIKHGTHEVLKALRERGHSLIMLTKGDHRVQNIKVDKAGLRDYFDQIIVVKDKSPEILQNLI